MASSKAHPSGSRAPFQRRNIVVDLLTWDDNKGIFFFLNKGNLQKDEKKMHNRSRCVHIFR